MDFSNFSKPVLPNFKTKLDHYDCYYVAYDKEGNEIDHGNARACHGWKITDSITSEHTFYVLISTDQCPYGVAELERWAEYCRSIYMPIHYKGEETINFNPTGYETQKVFDFHVYEIDSSQIKSEVHAFSCVTIARLMYYFHFHYFIQIPYLTFKIKDTLGDKIDPLEALIMAHYVDRNVDGGHLIVDSEGMGLITVEQLAKRLDNMKKRRCNDFWNFSKFKHNSSDVYADLINKEKFEELYNLLKQ